LLLLVVVAGGLQHCGGSGGGGGGVGNVTDIGVLSTGRHDAVIGTGGSEGRTVLAAGCEIFLFRIEHTNK
jgi:hypothetical protein